MPTADELSDTIKSAPKPEPKQIPFTLLERPQNRTTKLLANSGDDRPVQGQNRAYVYSFREPVFISFIEINTTGYRDYDRFEVEIVTDNKSRKLLSGNPKDDQLQLNIDEFCKEISFKPPSAWARLTSPNIQNVRIIGFQKSDVGRFISYAHALDELKDQALDDIKAKKEATALDIKKRQDAADARVAAAEQKEAELAQVNSEITQANDRLASLRSEIDTTTANLNALQAKTGANAKQLEAMESRMADLKNEVNIQTDKRDAAQAEIVKGETRLRELQANINLFPSEISGFVDQAARNTNLYINYSLGPLMIIIAMFFLLIVGAVDLTTVITEAKNVNLGAIVVSRSPYVIVASAIIYACYRIARMFITEVMNINRQRLSLTKISIIAKDIPIIPLTHVENRANNGAWKRKAPLPAPSFRFASSSSASPTKPPASITSWRCGSAARALNARRARRWLPTTSWRSAGPTFAPIAATT
jgi:hypothetical protein